MQSIRIGTTCVGLSLLVASATLRAQSPPMSDATAVTVSGGSVSFEVGTNVLSTTVQGQSNAITGSVRLRDNGSSLKLEQLEAVVKVATLKTGIKLRDEHMRKYIFETPDGQLPDIQFSAGTIDCAQASKGFVCSVAGSLAIRGTARPTTLTLKLERTDDGFHVTGDGKLLLSAYGIERPSQLGLKTEDEVKIHLDVKARNASTVAERIR